MAEQGKRLGTNANAKQPGTEQKVPTDIKSALAKQAMLNQNNNTNNSNQDINKKNNKNVDSTTSVLNSINTVISQVFQTVKLQQKSTDSTTTATLENKKILTEILQKLNFISTNKQTINNQKITVDISDVSNETISKFLNSFRSDVLDSLRNNVQEINTKLNNTTTTTTDLSALNTFLNDYKNITNEFINTFKDNTIDINSFNNAITTFSQTITNFKTQNSNIETQLNNAVNLLANIDNSVTDNFKNFTDNYINSISNKTPEINLNQSEIIKQVNDYLTKNNEDSKTINKEFSQENINNFLKSFENSSLIQNLNIGEKLDTRLTETEELFNKKIDELKNILSNVINKDSSNVSLIANDNNIKPTVTQQVTSENKENTNKLNLDMVSSPISILNKQNLTENQISITQNSLTDETKSAADNLSFVLPSKQTVLEQENDVHSKIFAATGSQVSLTDKLNENIYSVIDQQKEILTNLLNSIDDTTSKIYNTLLQYLEFLEEEREINARNSSNLVSKNSGNNKDEVTYNDIERIINDSSTAENNSTNNIENEDDESSGEFLDNALDLFSEGKGGKKRIFKKAGKKNFKKAGGKLLKRGVGRFGKRALIKIGGKGLAKAGLKVGSKAIGVAAPLMMAAGGVMGGVSGWQNARRNFWEGQCSYNFR